MQVHMENNIYERFPTFGESEVFDTKCGISRKVGLIIAKGETYLAIT